MSITPARPATIISICSVNSRFPLDFEQIIGYTKSVIPHAGVVELADARDSKSRVRKDVRVRPPPPAPKQGFQFLLESFNFSLYYKEKSTRKFDNLFKQIIIVFSGIMPRIMTRSYTLRASHFLRIKESELEHSLE